MTPSSSLLPKSCCGCAAFALAGASGALLVLCCLASECLHDGILHLQHGSFKHLEEEQPVTALMVHTSQCMTEQCSSAHLSLWYPVPCDPALKA